MRLRSARNPAALSPRLVMVVMAVVTVITTCGASPAARSYRRRWKTTGTDSAIIFPDQQRRYTTQRPWTGCEDYIDRPGRCVPLRSCPALRKLLATEGLTDTTAAHLLAGECGFWRGFRLVCCGYGDPPTTTTPPPPPEQHPNLAILKRGDPCGFSTVSPNIIGGRKTEPGEFPWVASLAYSHPDLAQPEANCGGTLIGQQYVLTAAHCVTNLPEGYELHSVHLGEHNLSTEEDCSEVSKGITLCLPPTQVFNVTEAIVHPQYNNPSLDRHDIALLRLDRPAVENAGVAKLCLPLGANRVADLTGTNATVAGFGVTENGRSSDVMLSVKVPVVAREECAPVIAARGRTIGPSQLCAGAVLGKDSCVGDSGGPLFVSHRTIALYHLVGVTSFGPKTCGDGVVPGVYTRVSEYLNWILDNVHE